MSKYNEITAYWNHSMLFELQWQETESYSVAPREAVFLYFKENMCGKWTPGISTAAAIS